MFFNHTKTLLVVTFLLSSFRFLFIETSDITTTRSPQVARGNSHSSNYYDKITNQTSKYLSKEQSFAKNQKQNSTIPAIKPGQPLDKHHQHKLNIDNNLAQKKTNESIATSSRSGQSIEKRNNIQQQDDDNRRYQAVLDGDDTRIPIWNIAHMINSIEQILPAIQAGSNGIEVDISFDKRGFPIESYHGFPCDCGRHCHYREDFVKFVKYISEITHPNGSSNNLQLILFDLKLKDLNEQQKERAGYYLATILYENLFKKYNTIIDHQRPNYYAPYDDNNNESIFHPPIRVIISINHVTDVILIKSFLNHLRQNRLDFMGNQVGFDVGMNDNLTDISQMWDDLSGLTLNVWQGDGLTNCANIVRGVERLKEAISIRNQQGHFKKIYYWTADVMYQIRSVLRLGLDAILTNQPQRVNQVLEENEFKFKYRLATPFDYPFAQFLIKPSAWKMSAPTLGEAIETVTNIKRTSADFVKTIPDGLSAIVKKVHSAITSQK